MLVAWVAWAGVVVAWRSVVAVELATAWGCPTVLVALPVVVATPAGRVGPEAVVAHPPSTIRTLARRTILVHRMPRQSIFASELRVT